MKWTNFLKDTICLTHTRILNHYTLVQTHKNVQHQTVDLMVNYNLWVIIAMGDTVIGEAMHVTGQGEYGNSLDLHFIFAVSLKLF